MVTQLVRYWTYRIFAPGSLLQATHKSFQSFQSFQSLLAFDTRSHELIAELEGLYYRGHRVDFSQITLTHEALITNVTGMVTCLEQMAPGSHPDLAQYLKKLSFYSRFFLASPRPHFGTPFVQHLNGSVLRKNSVGAKTAPLSLLAPRLGLTVTAGFVIYSSSFSTLIDSNGLRPAINSLLPETDLDAMDHLSRISNEIKGLILNAILPKKVKRAILPQNTLLRRALSSFATGSWQRQERHLPRPGAWAERPPWRPWARVTSSQATSVSFLGSVASYPKMAV